MNEGVAYVVSINATQNLYRFFNSITGFHFYTANDSEKDLLSATLNSGLYLKVFHSLFILSIQ